MEKKTFGVWKVTVNSDTGNKNTTTGERPKLTGDSSEEKKEDEE